MLSTAGVSFAALALSLLFVSRAPTVEAIPVGADVHVRLFKGGELISDSSLRIDPSLEAEVILWLNELNRGGRFSRDMVSYVPNTTIVVDGRVKVVALANRLLYCVWDQKNGVWDQHSDTLTKVDRATIDTFLQRLAKAEKGTLENGDSSPPPPSK